MTSHSLAWFALALEILGLEDAHLESLDIRQSRELILLSKRTHIDPDTFLEDVGSSSSFHAKADLFIELYRWCVVGICGQFHLM